MNIQVASEILHIDNIYLITLTELKKKYHKMALHYHPDKNGGTEDSKVHFQNIGAAYDFLKREIEVIPSSSVEYTQEEDNYMNILHLFLSKLFTEDNLDIVLSILKDIVSVKLFETVDKETSIKIYDFIIKYKNILHISDATLEKVRLIILEKYKDVQIFILNPTLVDLLSNNFYKLTIDSNPYFIPLWHSEIVYNTGIIIKCIPDLPDNMEIDEDNNLIVYMDISFTFSLFLQNTIHFQIDKYSFDIPINKLYIKSHQTFIFKNQGISKIVETDIMNVSDKADIVFKIRFVKE
jgi:hypothetical protein